MSEWKQDAAKRRDERATKLDVETPYKKKKNASKWCKGKVGTKHDYGEPVNPFPRITWLKMVVRTCKNCGKKKWSDS